MSALTHKFIYFYKSDCSSCDCYSLPFLGVKNILLTSRYPVTHPIILPLILVQTGLDSAMASQTLLRPSILLGDYSEYRTPQSLHQYHGVSSACMQVCLEVSGSYYSWGHPPPMGHRSRWIKPPDTVCFGDKSGRHSAYFLGGPSTVLIALTSITLSVPSWLLFFPHLMFPTPSHPLPGMPSHKPLTLKPWSQTLLSGEPNVSICLSSDL